LAQGAKINDGLFETKIEKILVRFASPISTNTTQDDEEQDVEKQDGEQGAENQDDAQSSGEQGAVPAILQDVLKEMKEITDRQARDASRMLVLIAAMDHLSVV
ncbi:hypothetical protein BG015_003093, partial [Linnemannia schmuckeri]